MMGYSCFGPPLFDGTWLFYLHGSLQPKLPYVAYGTVTSGWDIGKDQTVHFYILLRCSSDENYILIEIFFDIYSWGFRLSVLIIPFGRLYISFYGCIADKEMNQIPNKHFQQKQAEGVFPIRCYFKNFKNHWSDNSMIRMLKCVPTTIKQGIDR
jgi:hypothetical protein